MMGNKHKNIILCGFMGSGKTTVGRVLAEMTGRRFVDMDDYIIARENKSVSKIFEDSGEAYFRQLETESAKELSEKSGLVIASGGGTLTVQTNIDIFKTNGVIVLLDTRIEIIKERLKDDTARPLLQKPDRDAVIEELYQKRLPLYRTAADIIIPADKDPLSVAQEIMKKIS